MVFPSSKHKYTICTGTAACLVSQRKTGALLEKTDGLKDIPCYHIPCLNTWHLNELTSKPSFSRHYIWAFLPQASFFQDILIPEGTHHLLATKKVLNTTTTCCISCGHLFKGLEDQTTAGAWQSLQLGQRSFSAFCSLSNSCILEMRSLCQQRIINLEPLLRSAPPHHPADQLQMIPVCRLGPAYVGLDSTIHKWCLFSFLNYMFCSY